MTLHISGVVYVLLLTLSTGVAHRPFQLASQTRKTVSKLSLVLPSNYHNVTNFYVYAVNSIFNRKMFSYLIFRPNAKNLVWIHALLLVLGGDKNPNPGPPHSDYQSHGSYCVAVLLNDDCEIQ